MEELIRIRIDELSRLRDEMIEKQKIDLARIDVRIEELNALSGQSGHADTVMTEMDLPFVTEGSMVLEDEPIVLRVQEPPIQPKKEIDIPPILQDVKVGQNEIEDFVNSLI